MEAPPPSKRLLQSKLQEAVQSVQWTYSLFWQICPQQGMLVWGDGYYNGAIKTRKTVQPMEVSPEEASLQRSQQLRELYESLSAGETNQPARRPCAALSPEDLTESEWFYLMCVSFSFPSGVGLPGKAYARQYHVWLTGANEVDSKTFSRAILAKSARIQTVVCVPLLDGVVELGTTERVLEDLALVQHIKSFFVFAGDSCAATTTDHLQYPNLPPKPALSEHSTSNPAMSSMDVDPPTVDGNNLVDEDAEEDEDEEEEEDDDEEGGEDQHERQSDSDQTVRNNNSRQAAAADYDEAGMVPAAAVAEPSELIMQLEMSEDIRLGSPDDVSNNLDTDFHLLAVGSSQGVASISVEADHDQQRRAESSQKWATMLEDPVLTSRNSLQPPPSGQIPLEEEDTHYSQTVSTVLHQKQPTGYVIYSAAAQSAFARWKNYHHHHHPLPIPLEGTSQWVLKYILFSVPHLHSKYRDENSPRSSSRGDHAGGGDVASRFRKGTPQEELSLSANHVLAERRRREKLNERFIILRSLVPFVTKMDKASILGDTIEYVKQLRKRIQDLEALNSLQIVEADNQRSRSGDQLHRTASCGSKLNQRITSSGQKGLDRARTGSGPGSEKKKLRIVEGSSGGGAMPVPAVATSVQVSIIESDALVELQCCTKEGLLLDVMQVLRELLIEVIAVQSSLNNGAFTAQLRAKVKDNADGKRASIVEVKRAINQIILQY